jgi:hypothetical protein
MRAGSCLRVFVCGGMGAASCLRVFVCGGMRAASCGGSTPAVLGFAGGLLLAGVRLRRHGGGLLRREHGW